SPGKKKQREFTQADINGVILEQSQQRQMQQPRKPGRRSAKVIDTDVSALPVQASSFNKV
ncbi:integrase, partial [Paraburkholderia rhynchosiae]